MSSAMAETMVTNSNIENTGNGWNRLFNADTAPKLAILCFAVWLHAANSMLAATTLPQAIDELGGARLIFWAFTLYLLGSILAGAGAGLCSRQIGLRTSLLLAAAVYGAGSVVCAAAWQMEVILFGRLLQGAGGGMLLALSYISANKLFAKAVMPRVLALISATWSVSAFCGPLIGGTFSTYGLWRFAYWAFALQALLFVAGAMFVMSNDRTRKQGSEVMFPGVRLAILSAAIILVAIAGTAAEDLLSPLLCAAGLVLVWVFLRTDKSTSEARMFPLTTLQLGSKTSIGLFMTFTAAAATMSFLVYGPVLLETLHGLSPLMSGYVIALEAVAWGLAAIAFSGAGPTLEKWLIRIGTATVALGVLGFSYTMPDGPLWGVVVCGLAQGAGFGMMWSFVMRRIITSVPDEEQDVASSAIPATQQVAFALGAAVAGIVANMAGFAEGLTADSARTVAFWVFAVFFPLVLVSNLAVWRLTR